MNVHAQAKEQTIVHGVIAGLIDTAITVGAFIAADSSVLLADSLKTTLEFIAVLLSWMTLRRINRGGHNYFDYGLDKLEDLSSLFIGMLMFASLVVIVVNAILNLMHPSHIGGAGVWVSLSAQVVYAVINGRLFLKNRRLAKEQTSSIIESQVRLFFTKALANIFILISLSLSLVFSGYGWSHYIDPIAALVIAGSMLIPAIGTFSISVNDLLDHTLEESHKLTILRELGPFVMEFTDLHDIRSRRAGSLVFVDIILEFDPDRKVGEVQEIIETLRTNIEKHVPSSRVTIGLATSGTPGTRERVKKAAGSRQRAVGLRQQAAGSSNS